MLLEERIVATSEAIESELRMLGNYPNYEVLGVLEKALDALRNERITIKRLAYRKEMESEQN